MTKVNPIIRSMTHEEASKLHLFNPGLMMELCNLILPLNAGTTDHIHTFREGNYLYVLVVNYRHGYLGIDQIDTEDGGIVTSIFLQGCELEELVGYRWQLLEPETMFKRLLEQF
jgi:hypothetical protein